MVADWLSLNRKFALAVIVAGDRIPVVVQTIKGRIVDPQLLDELELTTQISIERNKIDALIQFGIIGWRIFG